MKKILSILIGFVLCLFLVGCDNSEGTPFDYSSWNAVYKMQELGETSGFLIEYTYYSNIPDSARMAKLFGDYDDDDWGYDDDDWGYDDDYGYDDSFFDFDDDDMFQTLTIGMKDDIVFMAMDNYSMYVDFSNEAKLVMYASMPNEDTGVIEWQKQELMYTPTETKEYYKSQYSNFYEYLAPYDDVYGMTITSKYSDMICGRMCDRVTITEQLKNPEVEAYSSMIFCIDREYGICLNMGYEYKENGVKYEYGFKCTRYETDPIISLPMI